MHLCIRLWDTCIAESAEAGCAGFSIFPTFFCAGFLLERSAELRAGGFDEIMAFVQQPPTDMLKMGELEATISAAYVLMSSAQERAALPDAKGRPRSPSCSSNATEEAKPEGDAENIHSLSSSDVAKALVITDAPSNTPTTIQAGFKAVAPSATEVKLMQVVEATSADGHSLLSEDGVNTWATKDAPDSSPPVMQAVFEELPPSVTEVRWTDVVEPTSVDAHSLLSEDEVNAVVTKAAPNSIGEAHFEELALSVREAKAMEVAEDTSAGGHSPSSDEGSAVNSVSQEAALNEQRSQPFIVSFTMLEAVQGQASAVQCNGLQRGLGR